MGARAHRFSDAGPADGLLVFTDLDGTLLDHDDYSWEPARSVLGRLRECGCPVVLTSSKTLAELEAVQRDLGLEGPVISENGTLLALPPWLAPETAPGPSLEAIGPWLAQRRSPAYDTIVQALAALRAERGYRFVGFSDLSITDIARITGLTSKAAEAAQRRDGSEPLLWQDAPERLTELDLDLARLGLRRITGGRFHHVLGAGASKAAAMTALCSMLAEAGHAFATTVALGDGPNDLDMLAAADVPVLVTNPKAPAFDTTGIPGLVRTRGHGPAGWAEAIGELLGE